MATSSSTRRGRQSGADLKPPQAAIVKAMVVNRDGNRAPSGATGHHFIVDCADVIPIFIGVARDFPVEARCRTQCAAPPPWSSAVVLAPSTGLSETRTQ
jgi:hypothetical protein